MGEFFPTYDKIDEINGVATSFKSMDLMCKSYQDVEKFEKRIIKYVENLLAGKNNVTVNGKNVDIDKKVLNLIFPDVCLDENYKKVLTKLLEKYKDDCDFIFTVIPQC